MVPAVQEEESGLLCHCKTVSNHNFVSMHPNSISKRSPPPTFDSKIYKEEIMTAIDLLTDFKVKTAQFNKADLLAYLVNKSTDGMQLKPALCYT